MLAWRNLTIAEDFFLILEFTCHNCKSYIGNKEDLRKLKCECRFCIPCLKQKTVELGIDKGYKGGLIICECARQFDITSVTDLIPETDAQEQESKAVCSDLGCFKCGKKLRARETDALDVNKCKEIGLVYDKRQSQDLITHIVCSECELMMRNHIQKTLKGKNNLESKIINVSCHLCGLDHNISYKEWLLFIRKVGTKKTAQEEPKKRQSTMIETNCMMCLTKLRTQYEPETKQGEYNNIILNKEKSPVKHFLCISDVLRIKTQLKERVGNKDVNKEQATIKLPCEICKTEHSLKFEDFEKCYKEVKAGGGCCSVF